MNQAAYRNVDVERSSDRSSDRSFDLGIGQNQWRDKIEVRLDNRQVFFLFFGSALCACMLFVLGVIVGKRLESRGRAAIPEVQDPLAVLDRVNSPAGPGGAAAGAKTEPALTFPKALIGASARTHGTPVAPKTALPAAPKAPPAAPKAPPPSAAPKAPPAAAPKAPPPSAAPKATVGASGKLAATSAPKPALPAAASVSVAPAMAAPPPASTAGSTSASTSASASAKGKFTLVLSSFPDRSDADAFAKRFAAQGAYVAVSETPGKGNVYRVRVGNYASSQEAAAAKTAFEKQTSVIAYVAGR